MSKLARALVLGAMLAAMNLAGMTAVAHAQATNDQGKDARRPPKAKWGRPGASDQVDTTDPAARGQCNQ